MRGAASATADRAALPFDARRMSRYGHGACAGTITRRRKEMRRLRKAWGALCDPSRFHKELRNMDIQNRDQAPGIDELERKANELTALMLSLCEERIREVPAMPDARASSLAYAVMTVRDAIHTFLAVARIR